MAGLVWLSPPVAESLLKLHSLPPVDACTYIGADSGGKAHILKAFTFLSLLFQALAISLYYDLLPAACSAVSRQQFEEGLVGKELRRGRSASPLLTAVRREIWQELRRFNIPSNKTKNSAGTVCMASALTVSITLTCLFPTLLGVLKYSNSGGSCQPLALISITPLTSTLSRKISYWWTARGAWGRG